LKVPDVMTREVHTVERNDQIGLADKRMSEHRIRHLPVLDESGEVCAVVGQRDLFRGALLRTLGFGSRAEETLMKQVVVKEAISGELFPIGLDAPAGQAARLMLEQKIGCLPVIEDRKLVGILTESDFVRLAATG
jgi:CBS-domain-containing membrane protein